MTGQEIFDTVLAHLRKQGKASLNARGKCAYRGEGGTACAVGCLITDELYDPRIENWGVGSILNLRTNGVGIDETEAYREAYREALSRIVSHLGQENEALLADLQCAHDNQLAKLGLPYWERAMERIAGSHGLVYTPS